VDKIVVDKIEVHKIVVDKIVVDKIVVDKIQTSGRKIDGKLTGIAPYHVIVKKIKKMPLPRELFFINLNNSWNAISKV
jgi:hypothetical protein